ncbi:hypothetical protein [Tahibacter sp.]|uniref:hypothetical protein n=1 Tax=Tahibacter sp. TaxID=2056211 RepID=UPI0028C443CB|nr:hypothetical protein [Tahibacter sp.]
MAALARSVTCVDISGAVQYFGDARGSSHSPRYPLARSRAKSNFAAWLGLCPDTTITGGNVVSGKTKRCAYHRVACG